MQSKVRRIAQSRVLYLSRMWRALYLSFHLELCISYKRNSYALWSVMHYAMDYGVLCIMQCIMECYALCNALWSVMQCIMESYALCNALWSLMHYAMHYRILCIMECSHHRNKYIGRELIIICVHTNCTLTVIHFECTFSHSTSTGGLKVNLYRRRGKIRWAKYSWFQSH